MRVTKQQLKDCLHCIATTKQQYDGVNAQELQETWDAISQIVYQSNPNKKYFEVN